MTNSVYKSLQDNNEDQCVIVLGETGSGKTENCRMVIKFLSKISGRYTPLQRQRSSNSISSFKSSPNSSSSTPKHKPSAVFHSDKSTSCFKADGVRNKKMSRVEFDFSYQNTNNESEFKTEAMRICPKHKCCNQILSSSTSATSNPIEIPKKKNSQFQSNDYPTTSKSFTIYETINRVQKKVPSCLDPSDHRQMRNKCESLDLISVANQSIKHKPYVIDTSSSLDETVYVSKIGEETKSTKNEPTSYNVNNINLDNFKSAKRKVPTKYLAKLSSQLNNLETQTIKERIAQAEIFLEAMGGATTVRNRDSSRYVT